ncbi:MAG: glycosyltransferase family 4 protein [Firmicutes bacterium]|nr:glycosyltransferase family 4 protein [Bacillota bacterium]
MKIAIDARGAVWFRGTGIGTYTYQLAKGLATRANHEFLFFCPESAVTMMGEAPNVHRVAVPENPDWQVEQTHMMGAMLEAKIDLYHMPQNGLNLPQQVPFPVVVTLHDVIPYILPQTCNSTFLRRFLKQMPYIAKRADKLITVSHYSRKDILRHLEVPPEKIVVIYPAPEPIYVSLPQAPCREFLEECYGITGNPLILYVGGFSLRKNVGLLLRAFAASCKEVGSGAILVVAGRATPEVAGLLQLARALGIEKQLVFPGYVPVRDLPQFYCAADVFVYPSLYEGFGMPPLEAMACGTPTITSNAAALTEVVGEGAWQVEPYDEAGLTEAIVQVITDGKTAIRLAQKGREWVKRYSWKKAVTETMLVYEAVKRN